MTARLRELFHESEISNHAVFSSHYDLTLTFECKGVQVSSVEITNIFGKISTLNSLQKILVHISIDILV